MRSLLLLLHILPALLLADLPAQRSRVLGRVVDTSGEPVAKAKIRLISRVIPTLEVGALDVVEAETSERGTFRASVLEGRLYSGWASWLVDDTRVFSMVEEGIRVGARPRFVQAQKQFRARKLTVRRSEPYADMWPLRFRLRWPCETRHSDPLELDGDQLAIPALPYSKATRPKVEVRSKTGMLIVTWSLSANARITDKKARPMSFPVLVDERVRVTSSGKPVPGARVLSTSSWGGDWSEVGRTDENGDALCRVPRSAGVRSQKNAELRIVAKGFAASHCGWGWGRGHANGKKLAKRPERWDVELVEATPYGGRVLGFDGKAVQGALVSLQWQGYYRTSQASRSGYQTPKLNRTTGPDGRFSFEHLEVGASSITLRVLLPADHALPAQLDGYPAPPRLVPVITSKKRKADEEIGDVDLSKAKLLKIDLVHDGRPLRDALVTIGNSVEFRSWRSKLERSNRRGRATRIVLGGEDAIFAFHREHGWFAQKLREIEGTEIKIELRAFEVFSGRVTDSKGRPLEGVGISPSGWMQTGNVPFSNLVSQINTELLAGKTDADGRFRVPFVATAKRRTRVTLMYRKQSVNASQRFELLDQSLEDQKVQLAVDAGAKRRKKT